MENSASPLTVWVVRHGERSDHADPHWTLSTEGQRVPYDPPLTELDEYSTYRPVLGNTATKKPNSFNAKVSIPHESNPSSVESSEWIKPFVETSAGYAAKPSRYLILCSPFERCIQTAEAIAKGLRATTNATYDQHQNVGVAVEPALAEWHTEMYYAQAVPDTIIDEAAQRELYNRVRFTLEQLKSRATDGRLLDWYKCSINDKYRSLPPYPQGPRRIDLGLVKTSSSSSSISNNSNDTDNDDNELPIVIFVTHGRWLLTAMEIGCNKALIGYGVSYCAICRLSRSLALPESEFGWELEQMGSNRHLRDHMI
ncbi:hypothetical protein BDF19DRAFT_443992 [Syncephalis fuscata]|nr:hypothetical protein BDF19DRAFT_443992 [Syncephalis fuscata]